MTAPIPKSLTSRAAFATLGAAILLGALGDLVFEKAGIGINVMLWVAALAAAARWCALRAPDAPAGQSRWLLIAVGFASCFAIRDAAFLRTLDLFAVLLALGLPSLAHLARDQRLARLRDALSAVARTAGLVMYGPLALVASDADWSRVRERFPRRAGAVLGGLALAAPIVMLFGSLFANADPAFAAFARWLLHWDIAPLITHTGVAFWFAWLAAGLLRGWLWKPGPVTAAHGRLAPAVSVGAIPVGIAVGSMVTVFLLFVAVQARYLFGGASLVESVTGLTYAEYARSGFFELVTAAALAVPVLYGADAVVARENVRALQNLRRLGSVQLVLVAAVMASAIYRMGLYVQAFGLTQDRIVASAILAWLGAVLVIFASTVLRGRRERFTCAAIVSGFAVLAALNAANPELLIARVNVARAAEGKALDGETLAGLGADATPFLVSRGSALPAEVRCKVFTALWKRRGNDQRLHDWRAWNLARVRAADAVARESLADGCRDAGASVSPPPG